MRLVVIGSTGQLGRDFLGSLKQTRHNVVGLTHAQLEIQQPLQMAATLEPLTPDLVINCAAYNLVDRAEDEPDVAFRINALGPRNLARLCELHGWRLLHVSTDYVFGGITSERIATGQPLTELELPAPNNAYATSKLAGEYFVRSECPKSFIVRTCGLYGIAALQGQGKGNFVETMLRLGRDRPQLKVVDDQLCTPTSTADLATALTRLIETDAFGLYHATNAGQITWCQLAREIFRASQLSVEVLPITTAEFGAKARRPAFSVLDCGKLAGVIGGRLPDWHDALSRYLASRATVQLPQGVF